MDALRPAVVRIQTDRGSGTGFIIATPRGGEITFVTAAHVVDEAHKFTAFVSTGSDEIQISGLEVVKIDPVHDLALLRASRMPGMARGLYLNPAGVKVGQTIGAPGFPAVGSRFELNFGKGSITAATVEVGDRKYVQADLPINPGNSGGPVVDGCGTVIGVVVAMLRNVQRVNLIVPVSEVIALYEDYTAPRPPMREAVRERLTAFERAIRYNRGAEAAAFFTEGVLEGGVQERLKRHLQIVAARLKENLGVLEESGVLARLSNEAQVEELMSSLAEDERAVFYIYILLAKNVIGQHAALKLYLSTWITTAVFPGFQGLRVEEVTDVTEKSARAHLAITTSYGISYWSAQLVMDKGDLRIDGLNCVRGCKR